MNTAKREIVYINPIVPYESKKLRVAGYARVSSDSADQLNSFTSQVMHYTNLIEKNENYEMVDVYADEGITGVSTEKRTDFNRMLDDCRNGKIDRIISKSLSRFSRNTLDSISVIRELKSLNVSVYFEKEGIDTDKLTSENLLTLYSLLAQEESLSISKNCKKGNRMRMSKGEYVATNAPYGYRLVDKRLEIYEPEAEIVRLIFREYLSGYGLYSIIKTLNDKNIPCKVGATFWRMNIISDIIKNEKYTGDSLYQKTFTEDSIPYRKRINDGELEKYYIKNSHEGIIDHTIFKLANLLLQENNKKVTTESTESILGGKVKCSCCNSAFRRKNCYNKVYFVCRNKDESIVKCKTERISQEEIFTAFIELYNKLRQNYKSILLPMCTQLEKVREVKQRGNTELHNINKEIAELSEQNLTMTNLMSEGIIDSALFISQTNEINTKIAKLKQAKVILLHDNDKDELLETTEQLISVLEHSPEYIVEMESKLFEQLVDMITVEKGKEMTFHMMNGLKFKVGVSDVAE